MLGLAAFWFLSAPRPIAEASLPAGYQPDLANGEKMYHIGGCIACHKPGPDQAGADATLPSGGAPLKTPIGTLYPPNITGDKETGIGTWSDIQFVNAMQRGIDPEGNHLIPAFPYTSYAAMKTSDILDIKAYLMSLKPVSSPEHEASIPLEPVVRRGLGAWKLMGLNEQPWKADPSQSEAWNRGAYLVNGPGHCNECHTPRNALMVSDVSRLLEGGPHPDGQGKVPSLHGLIERKRYTDKADLVSAFQNGETLGYEHISAGGMGEVQTNISKLPQADVEAIAEYILSLK